MAEDDMSHMAEIFFNRQLPFSEHIVESGLHHISKGKEKALLDMQKKYGGHFLAHYEVPRPNGTLTKVTVISGMMFYSRIDAPYEIKVFDGREDNEPIGYQTDEDLMILIAKLLAEGEDDGI